MTVWWAIPMLISGGLFVGGVLALAWERVPAWRAASLLDFRPDFAHTLLRVDRVQPALLTICLVSTIGFALSSVGAARTLAQLAAGGFLVVLSGSAALLVPVQRRLVAPGSRQPSPDVEKLRTRCLRGHLVRTVVALATFILVVVATVLQGRRRTPPAMVAAAKSTGGS